MQRMKITFTYYTHNVFGRIFSVNVSPLQGLLGLSGPKLNQFFQQRPETEGLYSYLLTETYCKSLKLAATLNYEPGVVIYATPEKKAKLRLLQILYLLIVT